MTRVLSILLLCLLTAATGALAMSGGSPKPEAPPPSNPSVPPGGEQPQASGPRLEAEQTYALAYEEIAKAKKDLEAGKTKNAEKKFKRALERVEQAVALDASYHEAWNLVGYTARKLGNYDKAFAAYEKCLAIKFDYAPAREYLGEAWLEKDNLAKAQEQVVMLEKLNPGSEEAKTLRAAVEAYATAHGNMVKPDSTTIPVDSVKTVEK